MKRSGILNRFLAAIGILCLMLILIWIGFFVLTRSFVGRIYDEQVESASGAILYGIEERLLLLESRAYELSCARGIVKMLDAPEGILFYREGAALAGEGGALSSSLSGIDHVIVFDTNGRFFRLKGSIDNTTLKRACRLIQGGGGRILTVSSGEEQYIGTYEAVRNGDSVSGYVVLLVAETEIERILRAYNQSEDIGVILYSGDRILCSDRPLRDTDPETIRRSAAFTDEKEIGLSGFHLMLYREMRGAAGLFAYFRIALPVTVVILLMTTGLFVWYMRNHMVEPIELLRERTLKYLLKKQISAHFTVNTLNVIRALIRKGEDQTATDTCDDLAAMLRYANAGEEYIPLMEEFYVLEQYLDIMRTRYPGLIESDIGIGEAVEDLLIPRMLLQPIVENAIVHGLAGNKGHIRISAAAEQDGLCIRISDDGRGMDESRLSALTESLKAADQLEVSEPGELHHIALQNIEARIRMLCSGKYGIRIRSEAGAGTEVTLLLPFIRREDPAEEEQTP
ncbi:MAG: histidine kinase [Lachnospiraceae bacterium]|nr:histidine kinase [Lachnospiraceae bacterium]